jgi:hypothetical protein
MIPKHQKKIILNFKKTWLNYNEKLALEYGFVSI